MKLSEETIGALEGLIDGNGDHTPYQSGPELVDFFNDYGFEDEYGQGFPSRWYYAQEKLKELNGSESLGNLIEDYFHPLNFIDTEFNLKEAIDYLNEYLKFDGFKLEKYGEKFKIVEIENDLVELEEEPFLESGKINEEYIREQIQKCKKKIRREDYDGAITNARSLLETILVGIEARLVESPPEYDGELNRLFNRVREELNLDPSREDINDRLREILSGLIRIVSGIAGLRNKMSDAHVRTYRPDRHHAKLAVNAVNTVCDFLMETYKYQREKGLIEVD